MVEKPELQPVDIEDLSETACQQFEENRLKLVKYRFNCGPFTVMEGPPGVGKSYFVRTLKDDPSIRLYRENEIEKWKQEAVSKGVKKVLFIDEINLRRTDCSQYRDLLNNSPSIYDHGKYTPLTDDHVVLFAQNPNEYGGDRREPKLFEDIPQLKVPFEQLTPAFILHRILKPILHTIFTDQESEERARKIIESDFKAMRSIRDLQTKAIFECAKEKERKRAEVTGEEIAAEPVNKAMVCVGEKGFVITESRYPHYRAMQDLLQARLFKQDPNTTHDGARYNGTNGFILRGDPGSGKSEFMTQVLNDEHYEECATLLDDDVFSSKKFYYRLRASLANNMKIELLKTAFRQGAIVLIDEIDSCPLLETYLNAYLTGEDIDGSRPANPGFTLLATANGAAMKGRRILPEPLLSRTIAMEFNEYGRDELIQILTAKFITPLDTDDALKERMMRFLVDEFLLEQTINCSEKPTFRDLESVAAEYFEKNYTRYVALHLNENQHQFMLIYKNHSCLPLLLQKIERGEIKIEEKTTSDSLEKELMQLSQAQQGIFSKKTVAEANQIEKPKQQDLSI